MTTVREGWVVFDIFKQPMSFEPREKIEAWRAAGFHIGDESLGKPRGYTCRRVRVTIEELDEKGES